MGPRPTQTGGGYLLPFSGGEHISRPDRRTLLQCEGFAKAEPAVAITVLRLQAIAFVVITERDVARKYKYTANRF